MRRNLIEIYLLDGIIDGRRGKGISKKQRSAISYDSPTFKIINVPLKGVKIEVFVKFINRFIIYKIGLIFFILVLI